jgi:hypothetical protein
MAGRRRAMRHRVDKPQILVDAFARRFNRRGLRQALGHRASAQRRQALSLETPASHMM